MPRYARALVVEVYRRGVKTSIMAYDTDEIATKLGQTTTSVNVEAVIASLIRQAEDPAMFPNALIFIDAPVTISDFMKR